jgi:hypothetical protein
MSPLECRFEEEALAAVVQSRWPARVDPQLRTHVESCRICSEVVTVAGALDAVRDELLATAVVPDASRVWWLAQLRARREAVEAAGLPITAAQIFALACAMGLLGACFGATSTWFQSALRSVASSLTSLDPAALLASAAALPAGPAALVLGFVVVVFLVPTAVFVALGRD